MNLSASWIRTCIQNRQNKLQGKDLALTGRIYEYYEKRIQEGASQFVFYISCNQVVQMKYYCSVGACSVHKENEKFIQTLAEKPQRKRTVLQNVSRQYTNLNNIYIYIYIYIYILKYMMQCTLIHNVVKVSRCLFVTD